MIARDAGFGGMVTVIVTLARSPGATMTDFRENTAVAATSDQITNADRRANMRRL